LLTNSAFHQALSAYLYSQPSSSAVSFIYSILYIKEARHSFSKAYKLHIHYRVLLLSLQRLLRTGLEHLGCNCHLLKLEKAQRLPSRACFGSCLV
jgi:hypothetical protein